VLLDRTASTWSYTLINTEPPGSGNWISGFFLPINAPIRNVQSPTTWVADTDFATYINWANPEPAPYLNDVAPGATLSGFQFESDFEPLSVEYELSSYDHIISDLGPNGFGPTLVPTVSDAADAVPEPGSMILVLSGVLWTSAFFPWQRVRARRREVPAGD